MDNTLPPRFPPVLKRKRLAKGYKQEVLAATYLHVTPRALKSWETGTRTPPAAIVALLNYQLTGDPLAQELLTAYLIDDLLHQAHLQEQNGAFCELVMQVVRLLEAAASRDKGNEQAPGKHAQPLFGGDGLLQGLPQEQGAHVQPPRKEEEQEQGGLSNDHLQQLFAILELLRKQPELLPMAYGFLSQMATQPSLEP